MNPPILYTCRPCIQRGRLLLTGASDAVQKLAERTKTTHRLIFPVRRCVCLLLISFQELLQQYSNIQNRNQFIFVLIRLCAENFVCLLICQGLILGNKSRQ